MKKAVKIVGLIAFNITVVVSLAKISPFLVIGYKLISTALFQNKI